MTWSKKKFFYDARNIVTMSCVRYWKNSTNFEFAAFVALKWLKTARKWPDHKKVSFYDARDMVTMSCVRYWKNSTNFEFEAFLA